MIDGHIVIYIYYDRCAMSRHLHEMAGLGVNVGGKLVGWLQVRIDRYTTEETDGRMQSSDKRQQKLR